MMIKTSRVWSFHLTILIMNMNRKRTLTKAWARQGILPDTTSSFVIISSSVLQSLLKRYAVCRNCKEDLIIEEDSARHALGVLWKLKCTNEYSKSEKEKNVLVQLPWKQVTSLKLIDSSQRFRDSIKRMLLPESL